jgi:hypothetical protein
VVRGGAVVVVEGGVAGGIGVGSVVVGATAGALDGRVVGGLAGTSADGVGTSTGAVATGLPFAGGGAVGTTTLSYTSRTSVTTTGSSDVAVDPGTVVTPVVDVDGLGAPATASPPCRKLELEITTALAPTMAVAAATASALRRSICSSSSIDARPSPSTRDRRRGGRPQGPGSSLCRILPCGSRFGRYVAFSGTVVSGGERR